MFTLQTDEFNQLAANSTTEKAVSARTLSARTLSARTLSAKSNQLENADAQIEVNDQIADDDVTVVDDVPRPISAESQPNLVDIISINNEAAQIEADGIPENSELGAQAEVETINNNKILEIDNESIIDFIEPSPGHDILVIESDNESARLELEENETQGDEQQREEAQGDAQEREEQQGEVEQGEAVQVEQQQVEEQQVKEPKVEEQEEEQQEGKPQAENPEHDQSAEEIQTEEVETTQLPTEIVENNEGIEKAMVEEAYKSLSALSNRSKRSSKMIDTRENSASSKTNSGKARNSGRVSTSAKSLAASISSAKSSGRVKSSGHHTNDGDKPTVTAEQTNANEVKPSCGLSVQSVRSFTLHLPYYKY